jgi:hypothetical protein
MTAQLDTRLHFCPSRGMVHDRPTALGAFIRIIVRLYPDSSPAPSTGGITSSGAP